MDYSTMTYSELAEKKTIIEEKLKEKQEAALKAGKSWDSYCNSVREEMIELYWLEKEMRLKQEPTMTFGRQWKGTLVTLEEFVKEAKKGTITDSDTYGLYATETGQSDIKITPSDVIDGKVRTDFDNVIIYGIVKLD